MAYSLCYGNINNPLILFLHGSILSMHSEMGETEKLLALQ